MRRTRRILIAIAVVEGAGGFIAQGMESGSAPFALAYVILGIFSPVLVYQWCQADIVERRLTYPAGIPLLVGAAFPLGVPIYLFRTRSFLAASSGLLLSLVYVCGCLGMSMLGVMLYGRLLTEK